MMNRAIIFLGGIVLLGGLSVSAENPREPLAKIPAKQRASLKIRLDGYVKLYRERKWEKLFDLVTDTGRGGATRQTFVARMTAEHGTAFANYPDLLGFRLARAEVGIASGYDIYGCGESQREGMMFRGIAVVHGVFEHNDWFFTGWRFTEDPDGSCESISKPSWEPDNQMRWDKPMEELIPVADISPASRPRA